MSKEHEQVISIADVDALNLLGVGDVHLRQRHDPPPFSVTVSDSTSIKC